MNISMRFNNNILQLQNLTRPLLPSTWIFKVIYVNSIHIPTLLITQKKKRRVVLKRSVRDFPSNTHLIKLPVLLEE